MAMGEVVFLFTVAITVSALMLTCVGLAEWSVDGGTDDAETNDAAKRIAVLDGEAWVAWATKHRQNARKRVA